jgi:hypothetical protein
LPALLNTQFCSRCCTVCSVVQCAFAHSVVVVVETTSSSLSSPRTLPPASSPPRTHARTSSSSPRTRKPRRLSEPPEWTCVAQVRRCRPSCRSSSSPDLCRSSLLLSTLVSLKFVAVDPRGLVTHGRDLPVPRVDLSRSSSSLSTLVSLKFVAVDPRGLVTHGRDLFSRPQSGLATPECNSRTRSFPVPRVDTYLQPQGPQDL